MNVDLDTLHDGRADPDTRAVLEDWYLERHGKATRIGPVLHIVDADAADAAAYAAAADAYAAADADAYAAADADAYAAAAAYAAADADAYAAAAAADAYAAAAAADAYADADADAYAAADLNPTRSITNLLMGEPDMRNGLKVIQLRGNYGYAVTLVGWLRRVSGDEWELAPGFRTVIRQFGRRSIQELAGEGVKSDHTLTPPSRVAEPVHRLTLLRAPEALEDVWPEVPRPADWIEAKA